jgi:DNA-binding PadR family transcriptional regulator
MEIISLIRLQPVPSSIDTHADFLLYRIDSKDQYIYGGLIRLHILHHASKGPIFGVRFFEELARHGYKLSPDTFYPLLHGLEEKGYLSSTKEREGKRLRRLYQATPRGRKALLAARQKVSELFGELLEEE